MGSFSPNEVKGLASHDSDDLFNRFLTSQQRAMSQPERAAQISLRVRTRLYPALHLLVHRILIQRVRIKWRAWRPRRGQLRVKLIARRAEPRAVHASAQQIFRMHVDLRRDLLERQAWVIHTRF